jgi:hypothetical protein
MPKKSGYDKKNDRRNKLSGASSSTRTRSASNRSPRAVGELLIRSPAITRITHQLSRQQSWTAWLRETLPAELSAHILHAVPKESELVVFADTSAWSVRLRYAVAALVQPIRQRDPALVRVQVRVQRSTGTESANDAAELKRRHIP